MSRAWGANRLRIVALVVLVLIGVGLRAISLFSPALWVDEAESAINGFSILDYGVPIGEYLEMPVFENTLIRVNETDPEYAFDDASYATNGLAIYHGWLPLYSIAASLRLFGVEPDHAAPAQPRDLQSMRLRTAAARAPAILFSAVFLALFFLLARRSFSEATAWTALVAAVFANSLVWFGYQARYYSLTLLLITTVLLTLLRLARRGRAIDYALALPAYVLLFYTHQLSFFVAVLTFGALLPWLMRHRYWWLKIGLFALVGMALTVPWLVYTGYLEYVGQLPSALPLLDLPGDLLVYPAMRFDLTLLYVFGGLLLAGIWLIRRARKQPDPLQWVLPAYLLIVWMVIAYLAYLILMPAPSFFFNRLSIALIVPGMVLAAQIFAYTVSLFFGRFASVLAPALFLGFMLSMGRVGWRQPPEMTVDLYAPVNDLYALDLSDQARYYSPPNDHLQLAFYSGIPFQSIAPIRKSFLDDWPGEIVLVERVATKPDAALIGVENLTKVAREEGVELTPKQAERLSKQLANHAERLRVAQSGAQLTPPLMPLPAFAAPIQAEYEQMLSAEMQDWLARETKIPIFHGYQIESWDDWWKVFFYRFVDPDAHRGDNANFIDRFSRPEVLLPPGSPWKITISRDPVGT